MSLSSNSISDIKKTTGRMRKTNIQAIRLLVIPSLLFGILIGTANLTGPIYWLGQICGGMFFAQAFILLHEFGHRSMFKNQKLNTFFGHVFSLFVFIPYYNWLEIHDLHHKWTGYRDLDPTTEKTFSDRLAPTQEFIINFAWKFYIPVFTIGYRLGIYWKKEKLKRHLNAKNYFLCIKEMKLYLAFYFALILFFPKAVLFIMPALYLSWVFCDILSLSQHSHVQMNHSQGNPVEPLKYIEQVEFSRSLIFHPIIAKYFLFNFNYHEAHHAYPGLPCYYLDQVEVKAENSFSFFPWLKKVKSMQGIDFIFKSDAYRDGF